MARPTLAGMQIPVVLFSLAALGAAMPATLTAQAAPASTTAARLELSHVPEAARVAFGTGAAEISMGRPAAAIPHLAEAIRLDGGFGLARVVHAMYATMPMDERTRELDRGVTDALRGGAGEATLAMALRASRLNEVALAQELFRAAKALFPGDPMVAWGVAFLPGGSAGTTIAHRTITAREFTEAYPSWAAGHLQLGLALDAGGDRNGGIEAIQRAIALAPSAPQPHLIYGNLLRAEGRYLEALVHYRHFVEHGGAAATARTQVATTYQLQGRGDQARQELAAVLAEATTPIARVTAHRLIGISHALEGNLRLAESAHVAALAVDSAPVGPRSIVHREMAMFSALAGNGRGVSGHLASDSAPSAATVAQHAIILAVAGMNTEATAAVDAALRQAGDSPNALVQSRVALARALVHIDGRNGQAALEEAGHAGSSPLVYAVRALADQLGGQLAAARVQRDRVVGWPNFLMANLEHVLARRLVERVQ